MYSLAQKEISYKYYDHTLPLQNTQNEENNTVKINKVSTHTTKEVIEVEKEEKVQKDNYTLGKYLTIPIIMFLFGTE